MDNQNDASSANDASGERPGGSGLYERRNWWDKGQAKLRDQRKAAQVALIVDAFARQGVEVGVFPSDDRSRLAEMEFMYRRGVILLRDQDLERVRNWVDGEPEQAPEESQDRRRGAINGLTSFRLADRNTLGALDKVDRELGVGVARPDHILHITRPAGCCPAIEPEPGPARPDPEVNQSPDCDGAGVAVTVVDTGLVQEVVDSGLHEWLAGVTGEPEIADPADIGSYVGHGTFVAGMLRCMAPRADVDVKGLLFAGGAVVESDLAVNLAEALDTAPDIISMSAGTYTRKNLDLLGCTVVWEQRLSGLKGTVLVAAAGNDATREPFWPAASPWAVSVGALEVDGSRAPYSNFGSWVDVYARGSDVVNAYPNGKYVYREPPREGQTAIFTQAMARWSGTSFSTPLVAGLIASRVSGTGESARQAADALLGLARANATPGVGAVLEPGMGCPPREVREPGAAHEHCRCGCP